MGEPGGKTVSDLLTEVGICVQTAEFKSKAVEEVLRGRASGNMRTNELMLPVIAVSLAERAFGPMIGPMIVALGGSV